MITNNLLWTDVETTGLDPGSELILALGFKLTTIDLEPIASLNLVYRYDRNHLSMSPYVYDMHSKSGLLDMLHEGINPYEAYDPIRNFLNKYCPPNLPMKERPLIAGNSINFDRSFLYRNYHWYIHHVHYRSIDVSSMRTETSHMAPELLINAPQSRNAHLPLLDIDDSIELLRYLRKVIWSPVHQLTPV